jgi:hypothetical protein
VNIIGGSLRPQTVASVATDLGLDGHSHLSEHRGVAAHGPLAYLQPLSELRDADPSARLQQLHHREKPRRWPGTVHSDLLKKSMNNAERGTILTSFVVKIKSDQEPEEENQPKMNENAEIRPFPTPRSLPHLASCRG